MAPIAAPAIKASRYRNGNPISLTYSGSTTASQVYRRNSFPLPFVAIL
uniref:Uncharacterized protein n=1 Tax=Myoviridae sp. ctHP32 TaxID=2823539 RepID=A0A8S5LFX4_9CAUD|nr:MAG TPA: hypothetical protein [Myoviridae sp. ctHP32]